MLEKIISRLPWGNYAHNLNVSIFDMVMGRLNLRDKYSVRSYFLGTNNALNYICNILEKQYSINKNFKFGDILIPKFITSRQEKEAFIGEFFDFIYPYISNIIIENVGEGPYVYNKVSLNPKDVVIDAGANLGMFSALAASKQCIVYAFEPVKNIRNKYLSKTVEINSNINMVPLALSNTSGKTEIEVTNGELGGSSIVLKKSNSTKEVIETISLDEWAKQNNISKIDFIKADIEGAERLMLEGAQYILKTYAPKLAICTYHLPDDKEVLTNLILKANPNYKIEYKWKKLYANV